MILFGGASEEDRAAALTAARAAQPRTAARSRDRALLDAAIALATAGPRAARAALEASGAAAERELAFWAAELDYRAGNYAVAEAAYQALLAEPAPLFRGRIYDHDSSVLLYLDRPQDALRIGTLYRDAFPGEADAVAVYATTLAAAGRGDEAVAAAEEALRLNEGEDTFAGLAKVLALQGELIRAKDLYKKSIERAGDERRPIRRAALGLLQWMTGDAPAARATLAPCRRGGDEATIRQRGACLFVAGLVDRGDAAALATELDALAAEATALQPAYGNPAGLADLLRAYVAFTGNGCLFQRQPAPAPPDPAVVPTLQAAYAAPTDFYVAYHVPFLATWSACEAAALAAARGDRPAARAILAPIASRAPGRRWLVETLATWVK
jgi:tetratricopeptide (TPR) repeat protein